MINITQKEKELIVIGLNMRRNYIETGDPLTSAVDVERFGGKDKKVKALSIEQMQLVIDTDNLITKLYNMPA